MGALWVPPRVTRELKEESRRREAAAIDALDLAARERWVREINEQLDRVVPGMFLAGCPDPAPLDLVAQGALPGYWHLVWPGYHDGPLNVQPLTVGGDGRPQLGGDGPRAEPGSWVFDALAQADMWNDRAMRERKRIRAEAIREQRRREESEQRAFDEECLERYKAVSRAQVSLNRGTPWTQNASGRRPGTGHYTSTGADGGKLNMIEEADGGALDSG